MTLPKPTNAHPTVVLSQRPLAETRGRLAEHAHLLVNETNDAWPAERLIEAMADADALMAFMTDRVDAELLTNARRLAVVGGALKGYDNIDIAACDEAGVWATNVPDLLTVPTAELAIGLLIGLARHIRAGDAFVRDGFTGWSPRFYGMGLAGSRIGIIGMGAIGKAIAQRLLAFDTTLLYTETRPLENDSPFATQMTHVDLATLLHECDAVILATPLTPQTLHLIDSQTITRMRRGALLINPCRGSVVDETAVAEALNSGHLGGYASDVYEMEDLSRTPRPTHIDSRLLAHPNTLFTPHLGSAVTSVRRAIESRAADNILAVLRGETPPDAINTPRPAKRSC